jgi:hypothetical protein
VVGFTIGSRGEVPGKRKPVIREHDDDDFISFHLFAFIDPYWYMTFGYGTCQ